MSKYTKDVKDTFRESPKSVAKLFLTYEKEQLKEAKKVAKSNIKFLKKLLEKK